MRTLTPSLKQLESSKYLPETVLPPTGTSMEGEWHVSGDTGTAWLCRCMASFYLWLMMVIQKGLCSLFVPHFGNS
jgi:hypothetical protein